MPQGKATYVASEADLAWLLSKQRALHARSAENPGYTYGKLWGLVTDPANLRAAFLRVARNRGSRTGGVDRMTVRQVMAKGVDTFLSGLRSELRAGTYGPSPVRRVLIPKAGQPRAFRPLGIPTVKDRVVQAAIKNILEPIFEADFYPISHGFRPGRSVHGAMAHLRRWLEPWRAKKGGVSDIPYQWVIEGDIKGCFDNISHHGLMRRVRVRIGDLKLNRLILAFLKSGVLSKEQFFRTEAGTPQGGILSPLLANIALSVLDERYSKYLRPKGNETAEIIRFRMKRRGEIVKVPIRYADDFLILVGAKAGPDLTARVQQAAIEEKAAIANLLREEMGLELSETKTLISQPTSAIRFLGHSVRTRYVKELDATTCVLSIPKQKSQELRRTIKKIFRRATVRDTLASRLELLNPLLRGWGYFYRHTWMARRVFDKLDYYVWWTILRWLRKKHPSLGSKDLFGRYCWRKPGGRAFYFRDGGTTPFELKRIQQRSYRLGWMKPPAYVSMSMESPVHNERCTPGSEGGGRRRVSES
ncbi:group II intron reverse transcriptase/maturase [Sorangium sp. So ce1389]|uniref:group II intron reverse transcriptase/maturase n=1 Tax=Sorangium sp. So ce1389 TaxID=3133336 RepID=UPI003F601562